MEQSNFTPDKNKHITPIKLRKMMPHIYSPNGLHLEGAKFSGTSSPFKFSTPPTKFFTVRNPFDAALANRLHLPISSPSVFKKLPTPVKSEEKFEWTIDQIASLNPVPIEDHLDNQFDQPEDPEIEMTAQKNIEKYFSETKHIVPSPWDNPSSKHYPIVTPFDSDSTPVRNKIAVDKRDGTCQTVLTLPPTLPEEVERILHPYFSFNENQQQGDVTASQNDTMNLSLCRRLFNFSDNEEDNQSSESNTDYNQLSPKIASPDMIWNVRQHNESFERDDRLKSPSLSPVVKSQSTLAAVETNKKLTSIHQSTPTPSPQSVKSSPGVNGNELEESPLSPISKTNELLPTTSDAVTSVINEEEIRVENNSVLQTSRRSIKRLDFSDREMCLDYVPDTENLPDEQSSLLMGTSVLITGGVEEDCTYSSVNWDIENRSISNTSQVKHKNYLANVEDNLVKPVVFSEPNTSLMDISGSPVSFHQRRTRLRFRKQHSEHFDEHNKENIPTKVLLRRCFSDVPFGSKISNNRCKKYYNDVSLSSMEEDDDVRDRSLLDRSNMSPTFSYRSNEPFISQENTQDTGYNSNVDNNGTTVSITNMLTNTNIIGATTTESDWDLNVFSSTPTRQN